LQSANYLPNYFSSCVTVANNVDAAPCSFDLVNNNTGNKNKYPQYTMKELNCLPNSLVNITPGCKLIEDKPLCFYLSFNSSVKNILHILDLA